MALNSNAGNAVAAARESLSPRFPLAPPAGPPPSGKLPFALTGALSPRAATPLAALDSGNARPKHACRSRPSTQQSPRRALPAASGPYRPTTASSLQDGASAPRMAQARPTISAAAPAPAPAEEETPQPPRVTITAAADAAATSNDGDPARAAAAGRRDSRWKVLKRGTPRLLLPSSPTSPRSGGQKSPTSGGRRFAHASSGEEAIRFHSSERLWNVALHGWEERKAEAALRELIAPFGADEAEVALLKRYTQLLTLPRYTQLWRKGARMSSFYVLIRGRVRLSGRPAREHVHLARTLPPPGSALAGGAWLPSETTHVDSALAEEPSVLLHVKAADARAVPELARLCEAFAASVGDGWKSQLLKSVPFFTDLKAATLRRLSPLFSTELAQPGSCLMREGEIGATMYVLVQGTVSVMRYDDRAKGEVRLAVVRDDSDSTYFGELALFERKPRSATVRAEERCLLLTLHETDFPQFMKLIPDFRDRVLALKALNEGQHHLEKEEEKLRKSMARRGHGTGFGVDVGDEDEDEEEAAPPPPLAPWVETLYPRAAAAPAAAAASPRAAAVAAPPAAEKSSPTGERKRTKQLGVKTPLPKPTPEMLGLKAARAAAYAPRVAASVDGTLGFSGIRAAGSGGGWP